jgi:hypothetical protein
MRVLVKLLSGSLCISIFTFLVFGDAPKNLREQLTQAGLERVIDKGDDISVIDTRTKNIQLNKFDNCKLFFD